MRKTKSAVSSIAVRRLYDGDSAVDLYYIRDVLSWMAAAAQSTRITVAGSLAAILLPSIQDSRKEEE